MRLAIYTEASRKELTKDLIFQNVFKREHTRAFLAVLHYVNIRLKDLFGMELVQATTREKANQSSSKLKDAYIVRSIPELLDNEQFEWTDQEESWMPLLVTILSLILGSGRSMPFGMNNCHLRNLSALLLTRSLLRNHPFLQRLSRRVLVNCKWI
jgi:hypothetical protein